MKFIVSCCVGIMVSSASISAQEIAVGMAGPLSGPQAYLGTTWHNGFKLYVDGLNAAGGVNGVTIRYSQQDDKADPREGTLVAQKLCDDEDVVVGLVNLNSGVAQSTLPIYEDCGLPTITFASNPTLTQQGYQYMVRPVGNDFAGALLPAEHALKVLGAKTAVVVHDKQVYGQGISEIFTQNFVSGGGQLLDTLAVSPTDVDFTAVLAQIKAKNPDIIYLGAVMPQLSLFAKQMREQGIEAKLFMSDGAYHADFIDQAGQENAAGSFTAVQALPLDATPEGVEFTRLYKERFGEEPGTYSIYGYAHGQILEEALKIAKDTSRDSMRDALRSVKVQTTIGELEFDETGELKNGPFFLYEVIGQDFVLVASKL